MRRFYATFCLLVLVFLGAGSPAASEPLASADANWDGIEVHLMTVERRGSVLSVKWAVTNEGEEETRIFFVFTGTDPCYVIDEENGVKYYALTDKEGWAAAEVTGEATTCLQRAGHRARSARPDTAAGFVRRRGEPSPAIPRPRSGPSSSRKRSG